MAGIVDIIASDIRTVGQSDFVANSAVDDVAVNPPLGNGLDFFNAAGAAKFALGDNLLIRKVWSVIPWGFGPGGIAVTTYLHHIGIDFWDGASLFDLPPLYAGLVVPVLCQPIDFGAGLYAPMATTGPLRTLRLTSIFLRVSQINLPAALDGDRIPVQYYMEILHNSPMII